MWWLGEWTWWSWVPMMLAMAAFWAVVASVVVVTIRAQPRRRSHLAEDVLAERFARGEIDEAEYERRVDAVRASAESDHGGPISRGREQSR